MTAVSANAIINSVNGEDWGHNFNYALAIGLGAPFFSGEFALIGSGFLEGDIGAGRALTLNSGVFTAIGSLADRKSTRKTLPASQAHRDLMAAASSLTITRMAALPVRFHPLKP